MNDQKVSVVFHFRVGQVLTQSEFNLICKLLFCRPDQHEKYSITRGINTLAIGTRTKIVFANNDNDNDDDLKLELLVFWKYSPNILSLPLFTTNQISVFDGKSREFKNLNRNKRFSLIGVNVIRTLSTPELFYLKHQLCNYIEEKKSLGEIEVLCSNSSN